VLFLRFCVFAFLRFCVFKTPFPRPLHSRVHWFHWLLRPRWRHWTQLTHCEPPRVLNTGRLCAGLRRGRRPARA
jgi:hypothetical protein